MSVDARALWDAPPLPDFLRQVPHDFARRHLLLGVHASGTDVLLTGSTPDPAAAHNLGTLLGRVLPTRACDDAQVAGAIDRAYARAGEAIDLPTVTLDGPSADNALARAATDAEQDLTRADGKAPAVRLVDALLFHAVEQAASDVHVQPLRDRTLIRYRLDGSLRTVRELPAALGAIIASRIKVMAGLDVAERRTAQDGRASVSLGRSALASGGTRRIDLRVSTLPTTWGERVVLRVLDPAGAPHLTSFAALGMPADVQQTYCALASRSSGMLLTTGPTGSGKTTTLYTTLHWLCGITAPALDDHTDRNIMTVEDPVEYDLSASGLTISQTQVDPKKDVTFASGLRHILRQDPDVILVGEVRDHATAAVALQASLTGHLVLSTLHTIDSPSAAARLLDLGVEPFLVSSSLGGVLAQRLVRTIHRECNGHGCGACARSGLRGRVGVFEMLRVTPVVRDLIAARASAAAIHDAATREGMRTLADEGARLMRSGLTTRAEVARVLDTHDAIDVHAPREVAP